MSFLKKIKSVLALLNPWPVKRRSKAVKRKPKRLVRRKTIAKRVRTGKKQIKTRGNDRGKTQRKKALKRAVKILKKSEMDKTPRRDRKALPRQSVKPVQKKVMVGEVTHYFDRVKVAAFMITGAPIAEGDMLEFKGKSGAFKQKVSSLQINRVSVPAARAGDEVGLLVSKPVREGDYVFKL